jgi:hypothetical protein
MVAYSQDASGVLTGRSTCGGRSVGISFEEVENVREGESCDVASKPSKGN